MGGDAPLPKNCNKDKSKDIGYLFLLIENLSDHPITNVVFSFVSVTSTKDTSRLPINISNIFTYGPGDSEKMWAIMNKCKERSGEQPCENLEEKIIPVMRPHDQFVFPIFVYKKQINNEFAGKLLDDSSHTIWHQLVIWREAGLGACASSSAKRSSTSDSS